VIEQAFNLPDAIDGVRQTGGLIHDLPPEATRMLAGRYGLYTTVEPRDPGSLRECRRTLERERAYHTIAERVGSMLGRTAPYRHATNEGILGSCLTSVFGSVTRIDCEGVHLGRSELVDDTQKGIVTATRTCLTVPTIHHAEHLSIALQGLLATGSTEASYLVTTAGIEGAIPGRVIIHNLDEHAARSLSRSVEAVVAQQDKARGVVLPPTKRTYADWKRTGETFPHTVDQRLRSAERAYLLFEAFAEYEGRPDLAPRPKPRIIGQDSAAFFERIRDVFNGLIHDPSVRGGSHHNLEQHPVKSMRPLVEAGIELRRDKAAPEDVAQGPPPNRPATLTERGVTFSHERLCEARQRPARMAARVISSLVSLPTDVLGVAGSAIKYLPAGAETSSEAAADVQEWLRRKELAAAGGERLDELSHWLRRQQNGLLAWEKPRWLA